MRAGIPTTGVDGTRFRSRLEARWAHLFDAIGWQWEYEPFDLDGYVPDFLIMGETPLVVEVKPAASVNELQEYVPRLTSALGKREFLLVGASPLLPELGPGEGAWGRKPAGLLGQLWEDEQDWSINVAPASWCRCIGSERWSAPRYATEPDGSQGLLIEYGELLEKIDCLRFATVHEFGSYHKYPCGHYAGGDGGRDCDWEIEHKWVDARNATQWKTR